MKSFQLKEPTGWSGAPEDKPNYRKPCVLCGADTRFRTKEKALCDDCKENEEEVEQCVECAEWFVLEYYDERIGLIHSCPQCQERAYNSTL